MDGLYHQCTLNWHRGVNSIPQIRSIRVYYTIYINECWVLLSISKALKRKSIGTRNSSSCLQNKIYFASISFLSCSCLRWRIHYKIHIFLTWLFRQSIVMRDETSCLYILRECYIQKRRKKNSYSKLQSAAVVHQVNPYKHNAGTDEEKQNKKIMENRKKKINRKFN